jgi:hypothetical protein
MKHFTRATSLLCQLDWYFIILATLTWIIRMLLVLPWLVTSTPALRSKMLWWTLPVMQSSETTNDLSEGNTFQIQGNIGVNLNEKYTSSQIQCILVLPALVL